LGAVDVKTQELVITGNFARRAVQLKWPTNLGVYPYYYSTDSFFRRVQWSNMYNKYYLSQPFFLYQTFETHVENLE